MSVICKTESGNHCNGLASKLLIQSSCSFFFLIKEDFTEQVLGIHLVRLSYNTEGEHVIVVVAVLFILNCLFFNVIIINRYDIISKYVYIDFK